MSETYNPYEIVTRTVNQWMLVDDVNHNFWLGLARNHYINIAKRDKELASNKLADTIKKLHEEESPLTTGVYADLLNVSIGMVDWHKIAESLIEEIKEECDKMED